MKCKTLLRLMEESLFLLGGYLWSFIQYVDHGNSIMDKLD